MKLPLLVAILSIAMPAAALAGPASDAVKFFYVPEVKFEADAQYRERFTEPVTKLFDLNDQATKKIRIRSPASISIPVWMRRISTRRPCRRP